MSGEASPVIRLSPGVIDARRRRQDWRDEAECRRPDVLAIEPPVEFFPRTMEEAWPALAVCRSCPVQAQCLEQAIEADERHGVWGNTTEREREALMRRRKEARR